MARDYKDAVIEELADSEAALLERVAGLEGDMRDYRALCSVLLEDVRLLLLKINSDAAKWPKEPLSCVTQARIDALLAIQKAVRPWAREQVKALFEIEQRDAA